MVIPIAILCPPNFSMVSVHFDKASCKSNPGILLPEPVPIPSSSKLNKILGLKYISVILEETIPITP